MGFSGHNGTNGRRGFPGVPGLPGLPVSSCAVPVLMSWMCAGISWFARTSWNAGSSWREGSYSTMQYLFYFGAVVGS